MPQPGSTQDGTVRTGRVGAVKGRVVRAQQRIDSSTVGVVHRRLGDFQVMNKALLMAALGLMLFIPALITLSALLPLGSDHGFAASWAKRMALSPAAVNDLRQLFRTDHTVVGGWTALSSLITVFFAYGWAAELQSGYETIWEQRPAGWRHTWRPLTWLFSFFVLIGAVSASGRLAGGPAGALLTGLIGLPLTFLWAWWSQHLLLSARIGWRPLLPGAVATALGLFGFSVAMSLYLPGAIVSNFDTYGPIGVVFALLSWMIGFSVVMLGGPLVGQTWLQRRGARSD